MNCVIPGPNLKILGKAIHALAKVGDELYFEANENHLSLRTVNISTTVFGVVKFLTPFFTHYKIDDNESEQITYSQKGISCKIPIKALLGVFKFPHQMEKQVEICKIELNNSPNKILFKFRYKHNITKTQNIWLLDGDESLQVAELSNFDLNKISAGSAFYTQALANFQLTDGEVSFDVTPEKVILRNYVEGETSRLHHVRSQLSLSPSEFSLYKIVKNASITFSLRPFRAAIQFAENFNLNIMLTFQQAGKPVEITISNNITFEANFILATMNLDGDTQSTALSHTISTIPESNQKHDKLSEQDKTDLENIAWDDFNSEEINNAFKPREKKNNLTIQEKNHILIDDFNSAPVLIPDSPESPRSKKLRFHFQRCFEPTYNGTMLNDEEEIYAANSDPECEELLK